MQWDEGSFSWAADYRSPVQEKIDSLRAEIEAGDYKALKAVKLNVPFEELYPGESSAYQGKVAELNQAEADLAELEGKEAV